MKHKLYIYQDHLYGGLYISDHEQTYEERYCDQCGDSDCIYDVISSEEDIKEFVINNTTDRCCDCNKKFKQDEYLQCPYCGSENIDSSSYGTEYILEFAEEIKKKLEGLL